LVEVVKREGACAVAEGRHKDARRCAKLPAGHSQYDRLFGNPCYGWTMPVNSTHLEYDAALPAWLRARDVIAGEDAVKAGGGRYLPRLDSQTDDEYAAYKSRAAFFNATARTAEGYLGLIFRRPPFVKLPEGGSALGSALNQFRNDADMLGTTLLDYAKSIVSEVIGVGRCGTLMDWESDTENRVYASLYFAESILNWRVERINGRNLVTLVALHEQAAASKKQGDEFVEEPVEQIRVLRLVPGEKGAESRKRELSCVVELWQPQEKKGRNSKTEWKRVDQRTPLRLGKPLPLIPFVFHGPRHSLPAVEKLPLADIIAVNLDHYRLDADYKHGIHFTALPTAWVAGFDKSATLRIGSSTAWVTETPGATAGFLEFKGQGLSSFERAMDRDERLLAILGSRLLESQKRVGETAQAIELRQSGETSVLANIANSVSTSLTQVLRWAYWWNSTEDTPDNVTTEQVLLELNTDFSTKGLSASEIQSIVAAWQANAISRDTMTDLFRRGEVLPEGRSTEEETKLIASEPREPDQSGIPVRR
jgi:Domain of unknown function (DUF4055)